MKRAGLAGVALMVVSLTMVGNAWAETTTFTSQGCSVWTVPAGVTSVAMEATGAAGSPATFGEAVPGKGDGSSGALAPLVPGEALFVCVDTGGGAGGSTSGTESAGHGGGASAVSYGTKFERPVLVAAGGGGAGGQHENFLSFGFGGNAGEAGHEGSTTGSAGGAGTIGEVGAGGKGNFADGESGQKPSEEGPGRGGAGGSSFIAEEDGGGGGAGYFGGGGGGTGKAAGGGGGGGSDFCGGGATACEAHPQAGTSPIAGGEPGEANVTLTYTPEPTCPPKSPSVNVSALDSANGGPGGPSTNGRKRRCRKRPE